MLCRSRRPAPCRSTASPARTSRTPSSVLIKPIYLQWRRGTGQGQAQQDASLGSSSHTEGHQASPCPAAMTGQSWGEGSLVLQLCNYRVGSRRLGTYGEWMDLRAGSVSPSFSRAFPPCTGITESRKRSQGAWETLSSLRWFWKELSEHQLLPKDSGWLHDHVLPHYASPSSSLTA